MKENIESNGRIIRLILAVGFGYFAYSTSFEIKWLQNILYLFSIIMFITTIIGYCPLYDFFKENKGELKK